MSKTPDPAARRSRGGNAADIVVDMPTAFDPIQVAGIQLNNRIAMAPLTRRRAYGPDLSATCSIADYYVQRATAGLIVSEAMQPNPVGQGYTYTPGMHTCDQAWSWRQVTNRVHDAGGVIFAQLQHAGRMSHPELLGGGLHPVGPSAVRADGKVRVSTSGPAVRKPYPVPHSLTNAEIAETIDDFANAAERAMGAGFDGVELHGAYGYLIQQFLSSSANLRDDRYGGSIAGRVRFPMELVDAVATRIGVQKLALRISPGCTAQGIVEDDVDQLYVTLIQGLPTDLAFLDIFEFPGHRVLTHMLRAEWPGVMMLNPHENADDYPAGAAQLSVIDDGLADMVAFGTRFISNPDLVQRFRVKAPLACADEETYYLGDERGYTDYPSLPGP